MKKGFKHSEETKKKMSELKIGDKNPAKRKEVREKISNTLKGRPSGRKGEKWTEEQKEKRKGSGNPMYGKKGWNKNLTKEDHPSIKLTSKKQKINRKNQVIKSGQWYQYSEKICFYFDKLNKQYNLKIQHALNGGEKTIRGIKSVRYSCDGYLECNNRKIDIEVDGISHLTEDQKNKDKKRDEFINSLGILVIRINEEDLEKFNIREHL